jgi:hypothetical protein
MPYVVVLTVVTTAIALSVRGPGHAAASAAGVRPPGPVVSVGVLRRPPTVRWLPRELVASFVAPVYAAPIGVPVGELDGYRFFVIPGKDHEVCLMGLHGRGAAATDFGGCSPLDVLAKGVIWRSRQDGRVVDVVGLLRDGYTRVTADGQSVPVEHNVFFLHLTGTLLARASGPNVADQVIPLGARAPATLSRR